MRYKRSAHPYDLSGLRRRRILIECMFLVAGMLTFPLNGSAYGALATDEQRIPAISFESTAIVVTGVTPRAQIVLFGVERKASGYAMRTTRVSVTIESDQRGEARYDLKRPIAAWSIFAAVDAVSGDYTVASAGGTPVNVRPAQSLRMKGKSGEDFDSFDLDAHWIEAVCVRRGNGAWRLSLKDASDGDESSRRGTIQVGAARMKALGAAAQSLGKFQRHDVLIAIDPYTMSVVATAVNE